MEQKNTKENQKATLHFAIDTDLKNKSTTEARKIGLGLSSFIRLAMCEKLKQMEQKNK